MHIITFSWSFESHSFSIADKINSQTSSYLKGIGHNCLGVRVPNRLNTSNQSWIKSSEVSRRGNVRSAIH